MQRPRMGHRLRPAHRSTKVVGCPPRGRPRTRAGMCPPQPFGDISQQVLESVVNGRPPRGAPVRARARRRGPRREPDGACPICGSDRCSDYKSPNACAGCRPSGWSLHGHRRSTGRPAPLRDLRERCRLNGASERGATGAEQALRRRHRARTGGAAREPARRCDRLPTKRRPWCGAWCSPGPPLKEETGCTGAGFCSLATNYGPGVAFRRTPPPRSPRRGSVSGNRDAGVPGPT